MVLALDPVLTDGLFLWSLHVVLLCARILSGHHRPKNMQVNWKTMLTL